MVGKVFLVALLFLYIVTQIYATYIWKRKDEFIEALAENYIDLKGINVTSDAYNAESRTKICMLGNEEGAMMYVANAVNIAAHTNTIIKVKIPGIAQVQGVSPTIEVNITVIPCATNLSDHVMKTFYFGQGPIAKSIAVYSKGVYADIAECYGMFTEVHGG